MPMIGMVSNISALVDAITAGDKDAIITTARRYLRQGDPTSVLLGRIGMIVAHGDPDGHAILILNAAGGLSRWLNALPRNPEDDPRSHERELPLLVQALVATAAEVRAGKAAHDTYPDPFFPSDLQEGQTVNEKMHEAIYGNDRVLVERLLFGLYGTGADYRTMQVRIYDGISTTFQHGGHPLILAVRGTELLDTVEWGDRAPNILHWLTPHLPLHDAEPAWVNDVRAFLADSGHSLASLRTRLSGPKEESALPLRDLIASNADTTQVCQGVYDALIKGGASPRGVGSVIAVAAADVMEMVGDGDRDAFVRAAHGLLYSAAVRLVYTQVQDIEALPLLFSSAASINALRKELGEQSSQAQNQPAAARSTTLIGGLIPSALLATLSDQMKAQDLAGSLATARRYQQLGHDKRALWATIGLTAAQADAAADQGHTLQIVHAAGEESMAWPAILSDTSIDGFIQVALRAVVFAKRNELVTDL
jgi:hypothetical protein